MPPVDRAQRAQNPRNHPQSLRIQPEVMALAASLAREQGDGQVAVILRQALACGILVVAASAAPDGEGRLATLEPGDLAKALRRKLAAAIDLLVEYGQLPQGVIPSGEGTVSTRPSSSPAQQAREEVRHDQASVDFHPQMGDDLQSLGIGSGLSGTVSRG